ncbi:hypothetical protein C2S51_001587 [Perilla frutescens var. frutescens]|nr:hypothetical protein C2S51_001587 [Perilla frutescens var. frutescens]
MVEKCGRLPLAISLLGGVLSKKKSMDEWESVKENLSAYLHSGDGIIEEENEMLAVLNLSYKDLPYYLKPCFLYLGVFKEDETICPDNLYKRWIAQGMISDEMTGGKRKTLTHVAEFCLSELVSRCMIQVEVDDALPSLKYTTCKLHDAMRELCLSMGKRQEFGVEVLEYRYGKFESSLHEASSWSNSSDLDELPSSISNLAYLDTLDLSGSLNLRVPNHAFKKMLRFKHLILSDCVHVGHHRLRLDEGLDELETLEGNWNKLEFCLVSIKHGCELGLLSISEGVLMKLKEAFTCPNLHGMGIHVWVGSIGKILDECILSSRLESLILQDCRIEDDPMGFSCLKKLDFEDLPNLREWRVERGSMPLLSRLKIGRCRSFEEWRVERGAMPLLSELKIFACRGLKKVPDRVTSLAPNSPWVYSEPDHWLDDEDLPAPEVRRITGAMLSILIGRPLLLAFSAWRKISPMSTSLLSALHSSAKSNDRLRSKDLDRYTTTSRTPPTIHTIVQIEFNKYPSPFEPIPSIRANQALTNTYTIPWIKARMTSMCHPVYLPMTRSHPVHLNSGILNTTTTRPSPITSKNNSRHYLISWIAWCISLSASTHVQQSHKLSEVQLDVLNVKKSPKKSHMQKRAQKQKFESLHNPDLYLDWERKVDKIFECYDFPELQKVQLASLEFRGCAASWWEFQQTCRRRERHPPIDTWREMKDVMRGRFLPIHYERELEKKLNKIKQDARSIEEYHKELETALKVYEYNQ